MPIDRTKPVHLLTSDSALLRKNLPSSVIDQLIANGHAEELTEIERPGYEPDLPGDAMNRLDFTLTQAQIQALHTTPIELIPAPGAGSAIIPMFISLYKQSATAYGGGGEVKLLYTGQEAGIDVFGIGGGVPAQDLAAMLTASGLNYMNANVVPEMNSGTPYLTSAVNNKGIKIRAGGAFTGNGGTVKGTIFYSIVAIS